MREGAFLHGSGVNPECSARFRSLTKGRLFRLELVRGKSHH